MAWFGNYSNGFEGSLIFNLISLINLKIGNQVGNQVSNYVGTQGFLKVLSLKCLLRNIEGRKGVYQIINTNNQ